MTLVKMIKTLKYLKDKKIEAKRNESPKRWAIKNFKDKNKSYLYYYYRLNG